jgi:putative spermidine/putrescine transport system ATP-binding protein
MLSLRNVNRNFGTTKAVDAVALDVAQGELLCLLGPSGCGKSTLLRIIAGLARADSGNVAIGEEDVTALPANRRPTAMVFQSHALWPHMTVARNVGFGLRVRGIAAAEQRKRIGDVLELVGLAGFEKRYPSQMSGGQAQRVALARCLVVEPRILLMDEPFSALDAHLRQRLREDLKALQQRLGLTTIFVTHDQDEAMQLADRIAVMREGRIEQIDTPSNIYLRPDTLEVARFIGSMNETDVTVSNGLITWHGEKFAAEVDDGNYRALCRPEDVSLVPSGAEASVERIVDLGSSLRLHLRAADGHSLTVIVNRADLPAPNAPVFLRPSHLHLFVDGKRVTTTTPQAKITPTLLMQKNQRKTYARNLA